MHIRTFFGLTLLLSLTGCKKENDNGFDGWAGSWHAEYTVESELGPYTFMSVTYQWSAEMTLNKDGTGEVIHQAPNIFFLDQETKEQVVWEQINEDSIGIYSLNSSRVDRMKYEILKIGDNYRQIQGFDDFDDPWTVEMFRKE